MNKRTPVALILVTAVAIAFGPEPNAVAETFGGDQSNSPASDLGARLASLSEKVAQLETACAYERCADKSPGTEGVPGSAAVTPMDCVMGISPLLSQSALPGHPGASHLYHIGASDFFLDHSAHIRLSEQQKALLNGIKEQAMLSRNEWFRKLDRAEEELWELTSSDTPDAAHVEAKVRELERLRADQRLSAIKAVGGAVKVLEAGQIEKLIGEPNLPAPPNEGSSDTP